MTEATSDYLNAQPRTEAEARIDCGRPNAIRAIVPAKARVSLPSQYYVNVYLDKFCPEQGLLIAELSEAYEEILESRSNYQHTIHVWTEDGKRQSRILYMEDDARAWKRS